MKYRDSIDDQIKAAECELAIIDAKRKSLHDRIRKLQEVKQSIADEQLQFKRLSNQIDTRRSRKSTGLYYIAMIGTA